jgi:hypothetical protein
MKYIILFLLSFLVVSCAIPRYILSVENIIPQNIVDSIEVRTTRATILLAHTSLYPTIYIEIANKKNSTIYFNINSILKIDTDSVCATLIPSNRFSLPDSLVQISTKCHYEARLFFVTDINQVTINDKTTFILNLDLLNEKKEKITKNVIFRPNK